MNSVIVSTTSPEQTKSVDQRLSSEAAFIYARNPPAFMQTEGTYLKKNCAKDICRKYI